MKIGIFIVALFILLKPIIPVFEYIVNYDYISKVLCENKSIPAKGCEGKCYLMSNLADSAEAEKPLSEKKTVVKDLENLFVQELIHCFHNSTNTIFVAKLNWSFSDLYHYLDAATSYRPPIVIS